MGHGDKRRPPQAVRAIRGASVSCMVIENTHTVLRDCRIEVGEAARAATGIEASVSTTLQRPANAAEFQRDWRRHCKTVQDKMAYLDLCGVENISRHVARPFHICDALASRTAQGPTRRLEPRIRRSIFKVEINGPLLSEILVALAEFGRSSPEHGSAALGYMEALAQGGRFSLNVKLISRAAKDAVRGLMESGEAWTCAMCVASARDADVPWL